MNSGFSGYRTPLTRVEFMVLLENILFMLYVERIHIILFILFYCSRGYLPSKFMNTAIVPIIKNKTGGTIDNKMYARRTHSFFQSKNPIH